ncbi:MAG: RidA family protein [Micromonosporaceae bacterium]|nr:RidA family protein [Micromonosporaceae bacterium]
MPIVQQRLANLGLTLPSAAVPVGAYVTALREGNLVWTAGQLPLVDGALPVAGKVGHGDGRVTPEQGYDLARICALNALAAIQSVINDLDHITRIVKVVGFVASVPDFTGQPSVVNGASDLLVSVFGDAGRHARSAVGVCALPLDAPVEVELVVAVS